MEDAMEDKDLSYLYQRIARLEGENEKLEEHIAFLQEQVTDVLGKYHLLASETFLSHMKTASITPPMVP